MAISEPSGRPARPCPYRPAAVWLLVLHRGLLSVYLSMPANAAMRNHSIRFRRMMISNCVGHAILKSLYR